MSTSIGIVGLPNAGKSTLFNALLKKQAALAANYPFATIEPNTGIVDVPDNRLPKLAKIVNTSKIVPSTVEFVDIAGIVRGAHSGEGLGNKFLANIREVNAICYVLRFFEDENVAHVAGRVDPLEDLAILKEELILADLQTLQNQKEPKQNASKEEKARWEIVDTLKRHLNNGNTASTAHLSSEEKDLIKPLNLLTAKPAIYVANMNEDKLEQGGEVFKNFPHHPFIALSAKTESELIDLRDEEREELLSSVGITEPALNKLARVAHKTLGLMTFLTAGSLEVRAWTVRKGATAPQAAGVIHTDFTKKFIKADVVNYQDFIDNNGWLNARNKGLVRSEGKEYIMKENDIVEFKIGA
jgi:ribosome-binding ATPase